MEPEFSFREIRFGSAEYQAECALRQAVLRAPLGLNLYREDLAREAAQWHFGLFDAAGALAGCAIAAPLGDGTARLRQMAVAPARQRQGCGRRIMRGVEAVLAQRGILRVTLHARMTAVGFYEALGYVRVGEPFIEVTIPHVCMEKALARDAARGGRTCGGTEP